MAKKKPDELYRIRVEIKCYVGGKFHQSSEQEVAVTSLDPGRLYDLLERCRVKAVAAVKEL
jgi:hypothetical protein